jgi:hypothetical protein
MIFWRFSIYDPLIDRHHPHSTFVPQVRIAARKSPLRFPEAANAVGISGLLVIAKKAHVARDVSGIDVLSGTDDIQLKCHGIVEKSIDKGLRQTFLDELSFVDTGIARTSQC